MAKAFLLFLPSLICNEIIGRSVAQTFPISELSKGHRKKLIEAGKTLNLVMPLITIDAMVKSFSGRCSMTCAKTILPERISHLLPVKFSARVAQRPFQIQIISNGHYCILIILYL